MDINEDCMVDKTPDYMVDRTRAPDSTLDSGYRSSSDIKQTTLLSSAAISYGSINDEIQNQPCSSSPLPRVGVAQKKEDLNGNELNGSAEKKDTTEVATVNSNSRPNGQDSAPIRLIGCLKGKSAHANSVARERENSTEAEVEAGILGAFRFDYVLDLLQDTADLVSIAVNSLAESGEFFSTVSPCLFDVLKTCDAWSLLLTSLKTGSNDIIEKLHIACLKFVEGFPEYALVDLQQVEKYVRGIKAAVEKMQSGLSDAMDSLQLVESDLPTYSKTSPLLQSLEANARLDNSILRRTNNFQSLNQLMVEYRHLRRNLKNALYLRLFASSTVLGCSESAMNAFENLDKLSTNIQKDSQQFQSDKETLDIAQHSLSMALRKYSKVANVLHAAGYTTDTWITECRSIIGEFEANVNGTKELTEGERVTLLEESNVVIELKMYLQRWRFIYKVSAASLYSLRPVRDRVENLYTENLYPRDAVKTAWECTLKHKELNGILKLPERYEPIPQDGALYTVENKTYALPLLLESLDKTEPSMDDEEGRLFQSEDLLQAKENMVSFGRLLEIANEIAPSRFRAHVKSLRRDLRNVQQAAYDNLLQYREETVGILLRLYFACLSLMQGLPEFACDGFQHGVLDIKGLTNLANAISSRGMAGPGVKTNLSAHLEAAAMDELETLVDKIDKETEELNVQYLEESPEDCQTTQHQTCRLEVIEKHLAAIDEVKLHAISAETLKQAEELLPLVSLLRVHFLLGYRVDTLLRQKQALSVDIDLADVYVKNEHGDRVLDTKWMERVHDLCARLNSYRLLCEAQLDLMEDEQMELLPSTRCASTALSLEECMIMVKRLGNRAWEERIRNVCTEIDRRVLKCADDENSDFTNDSSSFSDET